MELTGDQLKQFQQGLLSALPSKAKLAQMVSFQLDGNLDAIAGGNNLSDITFNLLKHHQAQGTLAQLLTAALTENSTNPKLQVFAQSLRYTATTQNDSAQQYLQTIFKKLIQNGATELTPGGTDASFNRIAQITDFEPGLGMRGDAFFLFSTFETLTPAGLRTYSAQCLNAAQRYPVSSPERAIFNFRFPTRCCFSVAIVQQLDSATATAIRNNNPFKDAVDLLWYEIPVIFDLSQQQLVYYQEASDFWENFRGEIAWKKLRETIQQLLNPQATS